MNAATSPSAKRNKRYRDRRKIGLAVYALQVDDVMMTEELVLKGWLRRDDADDRRKVEAAFKAAG